ncbi:EXS-domain-containing protein [Paxillus ammoniavirescens]|nr:EXS-domain-containing protein [Paxillus ammoniavirescens]
MFNPIRSIMWGRARWWTIKNVAKLGASGVWKVEFTDFWLGDQFTSLSYTFSNLYFVGCFYTRFSHTIPLLSAAPSPAVSTSSFSPFPLFLPFNVSTPGEAFAAQGLVDDLTSSAYDSYVREAQEAWITCGAAQNWGWYFALGALPFLIRFVQSLRRYRDSKLPTHLINAGKYGMGMTYYFFYYYWRHKGDVDNGSSYILWCFAATVYAIYACTWDFLMDWSMCKPHARHPFLRPELVYTSQIPAYYFALVSNVCIRFLWVFYIPSRGPEITWRTFVAAMLEMLRRIQWNFFRLENEHLGNMDQYRVTRELPLPYSIDTRSDGDGDEEDRDDDIKGTAAWFGGHAGVGKE